MAPKLKTLANKGIAIGKGAKSYLPLVDEILDDLWSDEGGKGKPTRKTLKTIIRYAVAIGVSLLASKIGIPLPI